MEGHTQAAGSSKSAGTNKNKTPVVKFQHQFSYQPLHQSHPQPNITNPRVELQMQTQTNLQVQTNQIARNPVEAELLQQDIKNVCNPDFKSPFTSIEDAVNRLLPYHVMADYEGEDEDEEGARLKQWDGNVLMKLKEYTTTFQNQVDSFNDMCKSRYMGESRTEERLMLEKAMLQEEQQELARLKAERDHWSQMQAQLQMQMNMNMNMNMNPMVPTSTMGLDAFAMHGGDMMRSWGGGSSSNVAEPSSDHGFFNVGNRGGMSSEMNSCCSFWKCFTV